MKTKSFQFIRLLTCIPVLMLGVSCLQAAPRKGSGSTAQSVVRSIDEEDALARIETFRNQRLNGDFSFKFQLIHMPRRGEKKTVEGTLWGSWNDQGPVYRVRITAGNKPEETKDLLIQSGPNPAIYEKSHRATTQLSAEEMLEPMIAGLVFTPYDLAMPFVFWENFDYETSERIKGRPTHVFLMHPPEDFMQATGPVRIYLDSQFNALIKAQWLNEKNTPERLLKMLNIKKISDQWLVKAIDIVHVPSRNKTRFKILSAALGLQLDSEKYFTPSSLDKEIEPLNAFFYENL